MNRVSTPLTDLERAVVTWSMLAHEATPNSADQEKCEVARRDACEALLAARKSQEARREPPGDLLWAEYHWLNRGGELTPWAFVGDRWHRASIQMHTKGYRYHAPCTPPAEPTGEGDVQARVDAAERLLHRFWLMGKTEGDYKAFCAARDGAVGRMTKTWTATVLQKADDEAEELHRYFNSKRETAGKRECVKCGTAFDGGDGDPCPGCEAPSNQASPSDEEIDDLWRETINSEYPRGDGPKTFALMRACVRAALSRFTPVREITDEQICSLGAIYSTFLANDSWSFTPAQVVEFARTLLSRAGGQ